MLLNEAEFEKLINEAMKDESSPSDILNAKLKQKIKRKYFIHNSFRGIKTAVACVAVIVTGAIILVNSNDGISNKLPDVPAGGNVAKVMTADEYNKEEIITHDNSEEKVKTTQTNSKATPKVQMKTQVTKETVETTIPKVENYKTEPDAIEEFPIAVNETVENTENMPSMARSVDAYNEHQLEIYSGDTEVEESLTIEEDNIVYEKLSDLYDSEYDYRKEISEKIINQVKERMTLNPEIKYNIDDDFTITGNEEFYINDKNELVIVFVEGDVAPEDLGKVEFNIGTIN